MTTTKIFLKRIGVMSLAKLQAILMAIIGLVYGIVVGAFGILLGPTLMTYMGMPTYLLGLGAVLIIIILPIAFAIIGFIIGALTAMGYNFIMRLIHGIELEVEERE
jgi:uncharacterized protein YacL